MFDWQRQQIRAQQDRQQMREALGTFGQARAPGMPPPGQQQQPAQPMPMGQPGAQNIGLSLDLNGMPGGQPGMQNPSFGGGAPGPAAGTQFGDMAARYGMGPGPMGPSQNQGPMGGGGPSGATAFAQGGAVEGQDGPLSPLQLWQLYKQRKAALGSRRQNNFAVGGRVSSFACRKAMS